MIEPQNLAFVMPQRSRSDWNTTGANSVNEAGCEDVPARPGTEEDSSSFIFTSKSWSIRDVLSASVAMTLQTAHRDRHLPVLQLRTTWDADTADLGTPGWIETLQKNPTMAIPCLLKERCCRAPLEARDHRC